MDNPEETQPQSETKCNETLELYHDPFFEIAKSCNEGIVRTKEYKKITQRLQDLIEPDFMPVIDLNFLRVVEFPTQLRLFGFNSQQITDFNTSLLKFGVR